MKLFILTFIICLGFIQVKAQLTVNAGNDVTACFPGSIEERTQLGGNPTASGGVEPYTYIWDGKIPVYDGDEVIKWIKASEFLDDTTKSNPTFKSIDAPDEWVTFYVKVKDASGGIVCDSVKIINAFFWSGGLYYFPVTIHKGDSIQFFGSNFLTSSFLPLKCSFIPTYGLSDPTNVYGWAKPDTTTTYYIQAVNSAGCVSSKIEYWRVIVDTNTVSADVEARQSTQCYLSGRDLVIILPQPQDGPYRVTITTISGALIHSGKYRERNLRVTNLNLKKKQVYLVSIASENDKQTFKLIGN